MPLETSPHLTELASRESAQARAEQLVERVAGQIEQTGARVWSVCRFLFFIGYLLIGLVNLWVWIVLAVVGVLHFGLRCVRHLLLWLSGGVAPRPGPPARTIVEGLQRDLEALWAERVIAYEAVMRPLARRYVLTKAGWRTFWYWHLSRKAAAIIFATIIVGIPGLYLIPRTHYVQITDDNAIHYEDNRVMYLVHGLDLFQAGKTREYMNEDAWWFGKINSQGLKAQLQIGHYYRLSVVGLRWYWKPRLFPNIIRATECDEQGNDLGAESSRIDVPVTPSRSRPPGPP